MEKDKEMTIEEIEKVYSNRFRTTDIKLAINKLKIKSYKTLKEGLATGKKSSNQLLAAQAILLLVKEYE